MAGIYFYIFYCFVDVCAIAMNLIFGSFIVSDFRCLSQLPAGSLLPTDCCSYNKIEHRKICRNSQHFINFFDGVCIVLSDSMYMSLQMFVSLQNELHISSLLYYRICQGRQGKGVFFAVFYETGHWYNFASL